MNNIILNSEQLKKAQESLKKADNNSIPEALKEAINDNNFYDTDLIRIILGGTGLGKTHNSITCLLNLVNERLKRDSLMPNQDVLIKPSEVLFLTSRAIIKEQTTNDYEEVEELGSFEIVNELFFSEKIQVATYHRLGQFINDEKSVKYAPKLIICDEIHSLYQEATFAGTLVHVIDWLNEQKAIKFGLTATNGFFNFLDENRDKEMLLSIDDLTIPNFKYYNELNPNKYEVENSIITNKSIVEIIEELPKEEKILVFVKSAKIAYNLSRSFEGADFICSKYSKSYFNDREAQKRVYLKDLCHDTREYVISNQDFPEDIRIIFTTSALREGANLKADSGITTIITEFYDETNIIQQKGRVRGDLKNLYVITPNEKNEFDKLKKQVDLSIKVSKKYKEYKILLKKVMGQEATEEEVKTMMKLNNELLEYTPKKFNLFESKEDEMPPLIIKRANGDLSFNGIAQSYLRYQDENLMLIRTNHQRAIPRLRAILEPFTAIGGVKVELITKQTKKELREAEKSIKIESVIEKYLGMPLIDETQTQFIKELVECGVRKSDRGANISFKLALEVAKEKGFNVKSKLITIEKGKRKKVKVIEK